IGGSFQKERSLKGWIVTAVTGLLLLGALSGGLFVFSSRPATSAHAQSATAGIWSAAASLPAARTGHTATLLPNGKVLITGGIDSNNNTLATAYLYDPAAATWTATGSLSTGRSDHTATLLPNGKVLVAGGENNGVTTTAELY